MSVKRFDNPINADKHLNTFVTTPHIHDPVYPGGVRTCFPWEIPK